MSTLRIGIVGLRFGRQHLQIATGTPGVRVVAIADRDPARLAECGDAFACTERHSEAHELLARKDLDLVVLAIPHHLHEPMALDALSRGLHVIIEKPIARTVIEAESMAAAARRADRVLAISTQQRFEDATHAAKAAIAGGALGRIVSARARWMLPRPFEGLWSRGSWFLDVALAGGGPLLDLGWHVLARALYLLGFPAVESLSCTLKRGVGKREAAKRGVAFELEDSARTDIRLAGGTPLCVEAGIFSDDIPAAIHDLRIEGERSTLVIADGTARLRARSGAEQALSAPGGRARSTIDHVARVIRGDEKLELGPKHAVEEQRIMEAAYLSDRLGRAVQLLQARGAAS